MKVMDTIDLWLDGKPKWVGALTAGLMMSAFLAVVLGGPLIPAYLVSLVFVNQFWPPLVTYLITLTTGTTALMYYVDERTD